MAKGSKLKGDTTVAQSRRASFDYEIEDRYECGMVLTGTEVKSLRNGGGNLSDAYVQVHRGELYLHGMKIAAYAHGNRENHANERVRKLLAHASEIETLQSESQRGMQLVPTKVYFKDGRAKVEVGVGRSRKKVDKRAAIKERETKASLRLVAGRRGRDYRED